MTTCQINYINAISSAASRGAPTSAGSILQAAGAAQATDSLTITDAGWYCSLGELSAALLQREAPLRHGSIEGVLVKEDEAADFAAALRELGVESLAVGKMMKFATETAMVQFAAELARLPLGSLELTDVDTFHVGDRKADGAQENKFVAALADSISPLRLRVSERALPAVAGLLRSSWARLESLTVVGACNLTPTLADAVGASATLRSLALSPRSGYAALASAMAKNCSITELRIFRSQLASPPSPGEAAALAAALEANDHLLRLEVELPAEGVEPLKGPFAERAGEPGISRVADARLDPYFERMAAVPARNRALQA